MASSAGVEPATFRLGGERSIQLSYEDFRSCLRAQIGAYPSMVAGWFCHLQLPGQPKPPRNRRSARRSQSVTWGHASGESIQPSHPEDVIAGVHIGDFAGHAECEIRA